MRRAKGARFGVRAGGPRGGARVRAVGRGGVRGVRAVGNAPGRRLLAAICGVGVLSRGHARAAAAGAPWEGREM
eukprot:51959-Rhodomonas_salina.1